MRPSTIIYLLVLVLAFVAIFMGLTTIYTLALIAILAAGCLLDAGGY